MGSVEVSTGPEELSLLGLSVLLLLGLIPLGTGLAVRSSDAFWAGLVRHAEAQRRLQRLPVLSPGRYDRDRRRVASVLTGLGYLIFLVSCFLVAEGLTRP